MARQQRSARDLANDELAVLDEGAFSAPSTHRRRVGEHVVADQVAGIDDRSWAWGRAFFLRWVAWPKNADPQAVVAIAENRIRFWPALIVVL